jgi:DNA-binding LacI/PurR family transcriptional regulator
MPRKKTASTQAVAGPLSVLAGLSAPSGQALHREITLRLRQLIVKSELAPGFRLPPIRELASAWGTNYFTVHTALAPLIKQGLLVSTPKKGTFVRRKAPPLQCVGIYHARKHWPNDEGAFYAAVQTALYSILHRKGLQCMVWMDERPDGSQEEPVPALQEAVKEGRIQALVAPLVNRHVVEWIRRFPIPHAYLTTVAIPGSVNLDQTLMTHLAVRQLKDSGCRSLGLITSECDPLEKDDTQPFQLSPVTRTFLDDARQHGLRVDERWLKRPPATPRSMTEMGYRFFRQLWAEPDRPEGLFVFPDMVARGVLAAVSEGRVRIPKDLRLVIHRNTEVEVFSPVPVASVESSATEVAESLFRQIKRQVAGREAPPIRLKPVLRTVE